jgi:hypothetical protein
LENDVGRSQQYLECFAEDVRVVEAINSGWARCEELDSDTKKEQHMAWSVQKNISSLNYFWKWRPEAINPSKMAFILSGPSPKSSISISCLVGMSGTVTFQAQIQPELVERPKRSLQKQIKSMLHFVERRASTICSFIQSSQLESPSQIGSFLRTIEWKFGRMEDAAAEIAMIRRRYKTTFSFEKSVMNSDSELIVSFGVPTKLRATFFVSDAYLFAPIDVQVEAVETTLDVAALQYLLVKKAKPGFGCLARTCGIISAHINSA